MGWFSNLFGTGKSERLETHCLQCGELEKVCAGCEKCKKCCRCGSESPAADEHDDDYEYLDD